MEAKAVRVCLGCDKGFASQSNGNRFCKPCACKKNRRKIKESSKCRLQSAQDYQRAALLAHYQRNVVAG